MVAVGAVGAIFSEGRYAGFSLAMPRAQERVEEQDTFTCLTVIHAEFIGALSICWALNLVPSFSGN